MSDSRLAVIWTSGDPDVAHRVCFMYTDNAKKQKWFDEVVLIVWGPSARLLAGDKDLQAKIKTMQADGVEHSGMPGLHRIIRRDRTASEARD